MIAKCWCEEEDTESAERGDHWQKDMLKFENLGLIESRLFSFGTL